MMTEITKNRPLCECHNVPKTWYKDSRKKNSGGFWGCTIKKRENDLRYRRTDNGKLKKKEFEQKWEMTPKAYVTRRKWWLNKMREKILIQLEEVQNG
jgi:hypothetical protein